MPNVNKKEQYEKIKKFVEDNGGKLISKEYINAKTEMEYICSFCSREDKSNSTKIFRSNACCSKCRYERSRNQLNNDIDELDKLFTEYGCTLLTEDYKSQKSLINYICKCGEKDTKSLSAFKLTPHCKKCSRDNKKSRITPLNEMVDYFTDFDCEVISHDKNIGIKTVFKFKCSCGNYDDKKFVDFRKFPMCKKCSKKQPNKFTIKDVSSFVKDNSNAKLLSSNYEDLNTKLELECECGGHFITNFHRFKYENKRQCNKCGIANRSRENSPFWKGGVTPENVSERQSKDYMNWREQVLNRDHYTCQCCGDNRGGNLQAHHIENFSENKSKRFDVDNGITLCGRCHDFRNYGSFHYIYGTKNNSLEQLQSFIHNYNFDCFMAI